MKYLEAVDEKLVALIYWIFILSIIFVALTWLCVLISWYKGKLRTWLSPYTLLSLLAVICLAIQMLVYFNDQDNDGTNENTVYALFWHFLSCLFSLSSMCMVLEYFNMFQDKLILQSNYRSTKRVLVTMTVILLFSVIISLPSYINHRNSEYVKFFEENAIHMTIYLVFGSAIPYILTMCGLGKLILMKGNLQRTFHVFLNQGKPNIEPCKDLNNRFLFVVCCLTSAYILPSFTWDLYVLLSNLEVISLSKTADVCCILMAIKIFIPCMSSLLNILLIHKPCETIFCIKGDRNSDKRNVITLGIVNKRFTYE